jgi:hypothetical protein
MFDPKKLGEEADALITKLNQQEKAGPLDGENKEPSVEKQESEQDDAITAEAENVQSDDIDKDVQTPETDSGVESTEEKDSENEVGYLRKQVEQADQRWKVLQGMITKKDEEIEAMRSLLSDISNAKPAQENKAPEIKQLVTKDDIEEYGNDMIDVMRRVASESMAKQFTSYTRKLEDRLAKLEGGISNVAKSTEEVSQNAFYATLDRLSPEWRELNENQDFISWLQQVDPYTGTTKMELLGLAHKNQDANRAAVFFNQYHSSLEKQEPSSTAKSAKEKLVAPGKAKSTTPKSESKRTWTRNEIAQVYANKRKGLISDKEFKALERDFFAAQSEGRIAA